jgi:nitrous oxide reductase accessory protein NosL
MASGQPELIGQGEAKKWCPTCGMSIKIFYKTAHGVKLKDGTSRQFCSIRCLAKEFLALKDHIDQVLVTDAKTEKLVDAKKAHYLVGSNIPGTMTRVSKLAFEGKADAQTFQNRYGGKIVTFFEAFKIAQMSLEKDIAMTTAKKKKMMYPMGKKIYDKTCQDIDPSRYATISELKASIKNKKFCKGDLPVKKFQALALYLWEVKRLGAESTIKPLNVTDDEKCPVCGMFVYKYPKWVAQIFTNDGHHLSFDGVKDMMKFYLEPSKWGASQDIKDTISKISVTNYYTHAGIDAKSAYYVIQSDVYGPMGHELIPFTTHKQAETFLKDHLGKRVVRFDEITMEMLEDLDKN